MKFHCILTSLACVAVLSACATTSPPVETVAKAPMTMKATMAEANAAALAGHPDKAYALMKQAGANWPADKTPWVRMAQMRFDSSNYGEAIVNALEALHRDPDDTVANSVVAVSGLRLSSKALADLTRKNNLSGTVRTEAQDLAKLLRTSLNEETLIPQTGRPASRTTTTKSKAVTASAAAVPAPTTKPAGADPFGALK